jgi:Transposase DDE domain
MYQKTVAALSARVAPYVGLSNDRRETLSQLTLGLLSARTTNLSVLAAERVAAASTASTHRRYQRFFQFADPGEDWAAPVVTALAGIEGPRTLILDRTNWKVGRREINLLMLAVKTRRGRLGLMWTVLDRAGNSGAKERIALIERYIARFGQESIGLLLGDREFIGTEWLNYLMKMDIPYVIRMRAGQRATTAEGRSGSLGRLLLGPGGERRATVTLDAMAEKGVPGPAIAVRAVRPKGREPVIVATNRPNLRALEAYRKRWAIESFFADAKTRGLNLEDTRLTDPRKLALLTAILAIAIAWANAAAVRLLGRNAPPRKKHGYLAKSLFRIGLDHLRRQLRAASLEALDPWEGLSGTQKRRRVV